MTPSPNDLNYAAPQPRSLLKGWILFTASFVPLISLCTVNKIAGERLPALLLYLARPYEMIFPRNIASIAALVIYVAVPTLIGIFLALAARKCTKGIKTPSAHVLRPLAWFPIAMCGGCILAIALAAFCLQLWRP